MSMNAVVIHGPGDIRVERKPKPSIQEPHDAIVKVALAGICGSELHAYRGHQKTSFGHIMVRFFRMATTLAETETLTGGQLCVSTIRVMSSLAL